MDKVKLPAKTCMCGSKITGADTHSACAACLGLQHARDAFASPVTCEHCARLSQKTLRRSVARQASLSPADPVMEVASPPSPELVKSTQGDLASTSCSWGDQLDAVAPLCRCCCATFVPLTTLEKHEAAPPEFGEVAHVKSVSGDESISLNSEDDCEPFIHVAAGDTHNSSPNLSTVVDLQDVCRRAAAKLCIKWPEAPTETTTSRYEGKRLPKVKSTARQLLLVFPECLEEATKSWSAPFSAKSPVLGGSALDWADMEGSGFSHIPPVKPLVASHLHPMQKSTMTSAGSALPSKTDCFQSTLTAKGYKAVAMSVRALTASSLLLAYQAELKDQMSASPTSDLWDELCVDLCLRLHRSAVQASGRAMALMVVQKKEPGG